MDTSTAPHANEDPSITSRSRFLNSFGVWGLLAAFLPQVLLAAWQPAEGPLMTRWATEVSPDKAHVEYPRPQMVRQKWLNLNGLWDFVIKPQTAEATEQIPSDVEFTGQILVPFPPESALSGVMKTVTEKDRLWYSRAFEVPASWQGQRVLLHFGAVDFEATVFVNGERLGQHRGGYDEFSFDITEALKPARNELVVSVWDPTDAGPNPRGKQVRRPDKRIFYTATSGIWQTVWLEPVAPAYIESLKINPDFDSSSVTIAITPAVEAEEARLEILDGGKVVQQKSIKALKRPGGEPTAQHQVKLAIPNVKPWSPDSPFLYGLRVSLLAKGQITDSVESYFGMRKVSLDKDHGVTKIFLNNRPFFMVGLLDQGFWPDGLYTAPTDEALRYDIEVTKKLGFNLARKHIKVESDRWYYWCDKLGLLVWQDMPSGDRFIGERDPDLRRTTASAHQFEAELKALIETHQNHPSIVMWVVFNAGWGQYDTPRIVALAKELDPTRLVDNASGWSDRGVGDVHDMHSYPGPASPVPEEDRAAVLGEFGGLGFKAEGHMWAGRTWGYRGVESAEKLTRRYVDMLRACYRLKDDRGLSAVVYTQLTDVEYEGNGLLTYDREVVKLDLAKVAVANRGRFPPEPKRVVLSATAQTETVTWRYTTEHPAGNWFNPDFDASNWEEGRAGFGTRGTPGAIIGTQWNTADIWLRREVSINEANLNDLRLLIHHDDDVEVYVNGFLAAREPGYIADYEEFDFRSEARTALKPGRNIIAVHCHQTFGGQYIDVGIVSFQAEKP